MPLILEHLGLPADRAWIEVPESGPHLPGATLTLRAGLEHGVAAPRRTMVLELRGPNGVVARQELVVTVLSPSRPIELSLRLPETAGVDYELVFEVAGEKVSDWLVTVPEQRVDARWDCEPRILRRGQLLRSVIRTGEIGLETGVAYGFERWDGAAWRFVDPFEGEPGAWAAMGIVIPARTDWPLRVRVPDRAAPGRHRVTKRVDARHRGIGDVMLSAEFSVRDAPAVDYESLLREGAWFGVRPGADRPGVLAALGEPDERGDDDRVWRYGDLELAFDADQLHEFFGHVIPDRLLDDLVTRDRVGAWSERLPSGALLEVERPHAGTFHRLQRFSLTR
jgi:hypothetical protein